MDFEAKIYRVKGMAVMLDSDLAKLYGVETKTLNQAVKRNLDRFPEDFSFICDFRDLHELRSQIVTFDHLSTQNYFRKPPRVFSENGVAMLSSVIRSKRAIQVNITIMRTFTKLRSFLSMENSTKDRLDKFEEGTNKIFKIVFERLDQIDKKIEPHLKKNRKKIGL